MKIMDNYKELALEVIEGECLDMLDVFSPEQIADSVCRIINHFSFTNRNFDFKFGDYQVKINNSRNNCFISFSNDENTGVARSCWSLINDEIDEYCIRDIVSMLNEAWYYCEN